MRPLTGPQFDPYRIPMPDVLQALDYPGARADDKSGVFLFKHPGGGLLRVIATARGGWDHVSVSLESRIPTWEEMEWVKRRFFRESETAMQLHVPVKDHVNHHPNVLHLWRPLRGTIPMPPARYV